MVDARRCISRFYYGRQGFSSLLAANPGAPFSVNRAMLGPMREKVCARCRLLRTALLCTVLGGAAGFGVLAYPEAGERWAELEPQVMMEVKVIETCRAWRSQGLAKGILSMLLHHPLVEDKIVYMVGYSWTWDLDGSGLNAQQYRNMLIRLFSPHEFIELQTNEPNICLKPENLFMGRVGSEVSDQVRQDFKWLRFGISP